MKFLLVALVATLLAGCAGVFSIERLSPWTGVVLLDSTDFKREATWGHKFSSVKRGDSVKVLGHQGNYWWVTNGSDTGFVEKGELEPSEIIAALRHPLRFRVAKSQGADAWGRAQGFVAKYAGMKVQTVSDYILETYNSHDGLFAYSVSRSPVGDEYEFTVDCLCKGGTERAVTRNAHLLALYIDTGELRSDYVYR